MYEGTSYSQYDINIDINIFIYKQVQACANITHCDLLPCVDIKLWFVRRSINFS